VQLNDPADAQQRGRQWLRPGPVACAERTGVAPHHEIVLQRFAETQDGQVASAAAGTGLLAQAPQDAAEVAAAVAL